MTIRNNIIIRELKMYFLIALPKDISQYSVVDQIWNEKPKTKDKSTINERYTVLDEIKVNGLSREVKKIVCEYA